MAVEPLSCPHCASDNLDVVGVEFERAPALAVRCKECGGRRGDDPQHAMRGISAWDD